MTRANPQALVGALGALAIMAGALTARAWTQKGPFSATIHGHEFQSAEVTGGDGCSVSVRLRFQAPPEKYRHHAAAMNVYRFRARVELSEGKLVLSRVFNNREPGARSYQFTYDTSAEGCWSRQLHKLVNVDVEGCHSRGCRVKDFK